MKPMFRAVGLLSAALFLLFPYYILGQSSQVTPNNQTGIVSYNTYAGDHEDVNLATGNLHVSLPLVSLPGRNHHDATVSLLYDSRQYELSPVIDPFYGFLGLSWKAVDGGGWRFNVPSLSKTQRCDPLGDFSDVYWADFVVTLPDGDKHHFSNTANHAYHQGACDGPITGGAPPGQTPTYSPDLSLKLDTSTADAVLHFKDGSSMVFYAYLGAANQVDWKDNNGNVITYLADGLGNVSITDTLGRVVNVTSTAVSYTDVNGQPRTIALGYTNQTVAPTFSQPVVYWNPGSSTVPLLSSVTLANGRSYTMQHNNFAELTKLAYPAGGYTRYAYGALQGWYQLSQSSTSGDVRVVTNSYSCANSTGSCTAGEERPTSYSATRQWLNANNTAMTVTDALGNYTTYTFSDSGTLSGFIDGCEPPSPRELTRTLHANGGATLRTIATDYSTVPDCGYGTSYMFPIRRTTTLDDGKVSKTEWDYDTLSGFSPTFLSENVKEERVFDYGSLTVPALKHRSTYLKVNPVNNVDYQNSLFILNRVASEQVYDSHSGADVLMAQTTYEFDNYTAGVTASGATKHDSAFGTGYLTRGNLTATSHWRNTDAAWLTTRNQYDDAGNILSITDPGAHTTQFSYADNFTDGINHNAKAYVTQTTLPATNGVNHIERRQYLFGAGLVAASCGQNFPIATSCANNLTLPQPDYATYLYDAMNRPIQVHVGDGGGKTISYNNDALPFSSTTNVTVTSLLSLSTEATMDGLGRTLQTRLTSDPEGTDYTDTTYDALGRVATVSNPYRSTTDGITTNQYDPLGRVTQVTKQDNSFSTVSYTGNCTTATDEAGKKRKSCFDALGRLTTVWEDPNGLNYETDYQYDVLGNLLRVDQKGSSPGDSTQWRTRLFTYNSLSQLLTAYNPESGTISYSYDPDGNLLYKTSPKANQTGSATTTISYCYDALHRLLTKGYSDSPNPAQQCTGTPPTLPTPAATFTYDQNTNGIGRLTSLTDQAGLGNYSYDSMGRISNETRVISGISKSMTYEYNLDGSLWKLHYPSTRTITYTPASLNGKTAGRTGLVQDQASNINFVTGLTGTATFAKYRPDGALTDFVSGYTPTFAGITNSFSFNNRLQPINMSASAPGQTVFSIGYDFHWQNGDNGNVYGITNYKDNNRNQTFTYDSLNRLISAQNAGTDCNRQTVNNLLAYWGNTYMYDAWGNLTNKTKIPAACSGENLNAAPALPNNQLAGYTYDAAGNMTYDPTPLHQFTYVYDQENRIATDTGGGLPTSYTYDSDGNRVKKASGSTGTLYWYLAPGIVAESDLSGATTSEYVFFNGERVARRDGVNDAGGVFYYFSDHLKTASVITDATGNPKAESDYYPWGGELQFVNADSNHYKFTGKERDSETGLDYFGARYYSNGLGRFTSVDPRPALSFQLAGDEKSMAKFQKMLSNPQTWNMYAYCLDNPLRYTDPSGETIIANEKDVNDEIKKRKLEKQRANLTKYARNLSKQVKAGKLDANKALDMFYNRAADLSTNKSDMLLLAAGSAMDIRGSVGNALTRDSLGIDSLHHFAFAAFNAYDATILSIPIPADLVATVANSLENGPPYSRADGTDADIIANTAGAKFGQQLFWTGNMSDPMRPSATIPEGKQRLHDLEHPEEHEKHGGVVK